ncbi:MAG: DUF3786 domain-containing protein [Candidatus Bathyarchaeota archaeon]|nr:DUF3786 domain-containing protein [Candidatus Bathyarchaeota archaeon]
MAPSDHWNWAKCRDKIRSLRGRLGFQDDEYLDFLGLRVNLDTGEISDVLKDELITGDDLHVKFTTQTVYYILSGFSDSDHTEPSGELITTKQLRGTKFGDLSNSGTRERLLRYFGENTDTLRRCTELLGGMKIEFPYGDLAVKINALPLIPITLVITEGDNEFPGDARVFYDRTIESFLDVERINFITILTVTRLRDAIQYLI